MVFLLALDFLGLEYTKVLVRFMEERQLMYMLNTSRTFHNWFPVLTMKFDNIQKSSTFKMDKYIIIQKICSAHISTLLGAQGVHVHSKQ